MGQKIHPTDSRLAVSRSQASRWCASNTQFTGMPKEGIEVRGFLKKRLKNASVGHVVIERPTKDAHITTYSSRPGMVIDRKGEDIELLKVELQRRMGVSVYVNIEEVRKPEAGAQLIADSIAQQLERRIMFHRVIKRAMQDTMCSSVQGIEIMSSDCLNGIEATRAERYREGHVPLHMPRADVDCGFSEAEATYNTIGIKVWMYKGGHLSHNDAPVVEEPQEERRKRPGRPEGRRREGEGRPVDRRHGASVGACRGIDVKTGE